MNASITTQRRRWRSILSGMWIYILLNMLFRDIHELFRNGFLEQALVGIVNGNSVTELNLFYGGIALQIPLLMVILPQLVSVALNRWLNLVASSLMFVGVVAFNNEPDMDDILFAFMEGLAMTAIFVLAWRGPRTTAAP